MSIVITLLEFFGPHNAHQEVANQQKPDDEPDDVSHGQSLSQAWA
jgi:hypothetical protein